MGRIKTVLVKRTTHKLFKNFADKFSEDFYKNKEIIRAHTNISSNKIINIIAGYTVRLVKQRRQNP